MKVHLAGLVTVCTLILAHRGGPLHAQGEWRVGDLVGLREGVCIREGPGLGYRAHTRVPEDDWTVRIIDGPRSADGKMWYDTSRRDAGDPSGGTGWVDHAQGDLCPKEGDSDRVVPDDWLAQLRRWWSAQGTISKWALSILVLALLVATWQGLSLNVWSLLRAAILGLIIWWVIDRTREVWEPTWSEIVGQGGPDLAVLLALIPLVAWLWPRLRFGRR